ncbi:response regulator [Spirosoma sp.]|uniref:response regulator transcription factor n=1 Tax=Spirosoma sp. TaxID=1899569 RepID=UPI00260E052E|nr:response regulator [Spirosoma sp.]MCX6216301.1 response regulator [Spirosoma sp.]
MKVLIVDDEPSILLSLEFLMKKEGYRVFIARDGDEAFDIIRQEVPDLLILDVMMARVDGYEVCRFVKQSPDYQHCKVIFLSAKSKEKDIQKGLDLGANLYIPKPFSTRELIAKVNELNILPKI